MAAARGIRFPFRFDPATGGVQTAEGDAKIRQNILMILGTRLGERPLLREFGTRIASLVHDPNDDVLADLIKTHVTEALLQWEPRVLITSAEVQQNEGELRLVLVYIVLPESRAERMVIPIA